MVCLGYWHPVFLSTIGRHREAIYSQQQLITCETVIKVLLPPSKAIAIFYNNLQHLQLFICYISIFPRRKSLVFEFLELNLFVSFRLKFYFQIEEISLLSFFFFILFSPCIIFIALFWSCPFIFQCWRVPSRSSTHA